MVIVPQGQMTQTNSCTQHNELKKPTASCVLNGIVCKRAPDLVLWVCHVIGHLIEKKEHLMYTTLVMLAPTPLIELVMLKVEIASVHNICMV